MSKSYSLPTFAVVVDSNVLYPKDPSKIVSPKFMAAWEQCRSHSTATLHVPEIVKGERLYQLFTIAQQALANAKKNLETIGNVSGFVSLHLPTEEELKTGVEERFDEWLKAAKAVLLSLPYDKIDWPQVVTKSIWRHAPFSPAGEGQDSEKGFRDCLILHTVEELVASLKTGHQAVFLCSDGLLRDAAIQRFDPSVFAAYEAASSFACYVTLARETANKEFWQSVFQRAPGVFYTPNDPECVYLKFNIYDQIVTRNAGAAKNLYEGALLPNSRSVSPVKLLIDTTTYCQTVDGTVRWRTRIRLARVVRTERKAWSSPPSSGLLIFLESLSKLLEYIHVQPFDIIWSTQIDGRGKFSKLAILEINSGTPSWEPAFLAAPKYNLADYVLSQDS